ncbi:MAG TPA: SDR family oxidoreductase [Polyangiales bacterium]|nr:SDR family oxidoreductase [Polyangiales bacterium]
MSHTLKPIREQVMVITGASSGIGLATALEAAKQGASVVLSARSEQALSEIAARIRDAGGKAIHVAADVADRAQVQRVADVAIETYGRIDTWINDAGVSIFGRLDQVEEDDNRRLFETNFWGVVNGSLVALPYLKTSHGALINIGSEVSDAVVPLQGMYSASKHAVKGFTDALRVELEHVDKAQIAITLIQPTAVNTPYPQHAANYMDREPKLPTPQIQPEAVAKAVLSAASHHRRDMRVGAMAVLNTWTARLLPALADKLTARQVSRQQRDAAASRDPKGALYQPGGTGQVRGQPA